MLKSLFRKMFYPENGEAVEQFRSSLERPTFCCQGSVFQQCELPLLCQYKESTRFFALFSVVGLAIYAASSRLLAAPIPLTAKLRCGRSTPEA